MRRSSEFSVSRQSGSPFSRACRPLAKRTGTNLRSRQVLTEYRRASNFGARYRSGAWRKSFGAKGFTRDGILKHGYPFRVVYRSEYRHFCALSVDFVTPYETRHSRKSQVPQGFVNLAGLAWIF